MLVALHEHARRVITDSPSKLQNKYKKNKVKETKDTSLPTEPQQTFDIIRKRGWTKRGGDPVHCTVFECEIRHTMISLNTH
jgi:hypothetical protein